MNKKLYKPFIGFTGQVDRSNVELSLRRRPDTLFYSPQQNLVLLTPIGTYATIRYQLHLYGTNWNYMGPTVTIIVPTVALGIGLSVTIFDPTVTIRE